jgi:O-antigen ligase
LNIPSDIWKDERPHQTVYAVGIALIWMAISISWTENSLIAALTQLMRYCRILIIPIVFLLIKSPDQALKIIRVWVIGQFFVIICSYLLWLGVPVPWASNFKAELDLTPFTSTLEQPIMNTIMFTVVWNFREYFQKIWGKHTVTLILFFTFFEIFFIMIGRTGILCMLILLTFMLWEQTNKKYKFMIVLFPFVFFTVIYHASSKIEQRTQEVISDVIKYQNGDHNTSQGNRLEFSKRSIQAIIERPIIGYGSGSWPIAYKMALKGESGKEGADNPHQQFLLWFVEGGVIAFILLINLYHAILRDSNKLELRARKTLRSVLIILLITSMMNCPLHGAGMSEFFGLIIALMLSFVKSKQTE